MKIIYNKKFKIPYKNFFYAEVYTPFKTYDIKDFKGIYREFYFNKSIKMYNL